MPGHAAAQPDGGSRPPGPPLRAALPAFLLLAACDGQVDFVVDATALADARPDGTLVVDLVRDGVLIERRELVLGVNPVLELRDAIEVPLTHGVAAWMDLDADEACDPDEDLAWAFEYYPGYNEDLVWVVDPEELIAPDACWWFDDLPTDLPTDPEDTDDE